MVPEMIRLDRRSLLIGSAISAFVHADGAVAGRPRAACGLDLSRAQFRSAADWNAAYEARWGALGRQTRRQIDYVIHNKNGVFDDKPGHFAWIVHYWIRAWLAMARLTHDSKYMDCCVSFIDYMFDHTDERRIRRGEIAENYIRDPAGYQGSGEGGPFWKRGRDAIVLNTGQISHAILLFVDAVYSDRVLWRGYAADADRYFAEAIRAVDAFNSDWRDDGDKGGYRYRDSGGSGRLGETRAAFNQSATMVRAHLLIHKWRPDIARAAKVRRLARYWIDDFYTPQSDGTATWRYIIHPEYPEIEDAGHASVDLDFLVAAYESGLTDLTDGHISALTKTYLRKVIDGRGGLNHTVDGKTKPDFNEHWNAAVGWWELSRYDRAVARAALDVYNAKYPFNAAPGILWARPMLGWANLLNAASPCRI